MVRYCRTEDKGRDQMGWFGDIVLKIKVVIRGGGQVMSY